MATSCVIGYVDENNEITATRCNFDGYLTGIGEELIKFFNDEKLAKRIVNSGEIRCIDERLSDSGKVEDMVEYYPSSSNTYPTSHEAIQNVYDEYQLIYMYIFMDGEWRYVTHKTLDLDKSELLSSLVQVEKKEEQVEESVDTTSKPNVTSDILAIIAKVTRTKGQIHTIVGERPCGIRKKYIKETGEEPVVMKRSTFQIRAGIKYDNQKKVKEKREDGRLPAENAGLRGMEWVDGYYPWLVKSIKSGKLYVCGAPVNPGSSKSTYYKDGEEIEKDELVDIVLGKDIKSSTPGDWMYYALDNIIEFR
jgi:hypothetical protein